ncbi:MAG: metallophosphoesterase family protein [Candidatus Woesearchaeota archaeon]
MVVFAHLADCHIGAWRDPRMSALADESFAMAISRCIAEEVDFVVIAGDLFHTALPAIERLRHVVKCLESLKQAGIAVYIIPGSHDYSPTGKTILGVLEEAGLVVNVYRESVVDDLIVLEPVVDTKTGVSLVGVLGRAGQLDTQKYSSLDRSSLEKLSSPKIFLFHAALSDLVSSRLAGENAASISLLPRGFDYYAGGHVHIVEDVSLDGYSRVVYPGPTFPASFSELELLGGGGFVLVREDSFERVSVVPREVLCVRLSCEGVSASQASEVLSEEVASLPVTDAVVLVRASGVLSSGTTSDIDFSSVFASAYERGAYACLKNTFGVSSPELAVASERVSSSLSASEIQQEVFSEYADEQFSASFMKQLFSALSQKQGDGETKTVYEQRVFADAKKLFSKD